MSSALEADSNPSLTSIPIIMFMYDFVLLVHRTLQKAEGAIRHGNKRHRERE